MKAFGFRGIEGDAFRPRSSTAEKPQSQTRYPKPQAPNLETRRTYDRRPDTLSPTPYTLPYPTLDPRTQTKHQPRRCRRADRHCRTVAPPPPGNTGFQGLRFGLESWKMYKPMRSLAPLGLFAAYMVLFRACCGFGASGVCLWWLGIPGQMSSEFRAQGFEGPFWVSCCGALKLLGSHPYRE